MDVLGLKWGVGKSTEATCPWTYGVTLSVKLYAEVTTPSQFGWGKKTWDLPGCGEIAIIPGGKCPDLRSGLPTKRDLLWAGRNATWRIQPTVIAAKAHRTRRISFAKIDALRAESTNNRSVWNTPFPPVGCLGISAAMCVVRTYIMKQVYLFLGNTCLCPFSFFFFLFFNLI